MYSKGARRNVLGMQRANEYFRFPSLAINASRTRSTCLDCSRDEHAVAAGMLAPAFCNIGAARSYHHGFLCFTEKKEVVGNRAH